MPRLNIRFPSNKTLGNICVYGAIASISAVMYMRWKMQERIRQAEFYRIAFSTLRQHKGAVNLLGEPIKDGGFDLSNTKNCCDAHTAQFEVKVNGSKDKGTVFFWANHDEAKGWLLERLELETKLHPNKRFVLSKLKKEEEKVEDNPQEEQSDAYIFQKQFMQKEQEEGNQQTNAHSQMSTSNNQLLANTKTLA